MKLFRATLIGLLSLGGVATAAAQKTSSRPATGDLLSGPATLRDIFSRARRAAENIEDEKEKSRAMVEIVLVEAKSGHIAEALETSRGVPDSGDRVSALAAVAAAQAKQGDLKTAEATAALATQGSSTGMLIPLSDAQRQAYRATVLRSVAAVRASLGDIEGVRETMAAARTDGSSSSTGFLKFLAIAQAVSGAPDDARRSFLDYLRSLPDSAGTVENTVLARVLVADALLQAGRLSAALEAADQVPNEGKRAETLARVAVKQAEAGDRDGVTATIRSAAEALSAFRDLYGFDKSRAALSLVNARVAAGDFSGARETVGMITDSYLKGQAVSAIAVGLAKAHKTEAALTTALQIDEDPLSQDREETLREIAIAQAQTGDVTAAEKTLDLLPRQADTSDVLAEVAIAQAKAGEYEAAIATSRRLSPGQRRSWNFRIFAVRGIARAEARNGGSRGGFRWISDLGSATLESSAWLGVAEGLLSAEGEK